MKTTHHTDYLGNLILQNGKPQVYRFAGGYASFDADPIDGYAFDLGPIPFDRFSARDPLAEKYYSISPYAYCDGDPVNLVDPSGMSISVSGDSADIAMLVSIMNQYGSNTYYYENVVINYLPASSGNGNNYDNIYTQLVDNEFDPAINLVNGTEIPIADCRSSKLDISDIKKNGNEKIITSGSVLGRELIEQWIYQREKYSTSNGREKIDLIDKAHNIGIDVESYMTNSGYIRKDEKITFINGTMRVTFKAIDEKANPRWNQIIYNVENGNITGVKAHY